MVEKNLDEIEKELDEFIDCCSGNPLFNKLVDKIIEITKLENPRQPYDYVRREDVVNELYGIFLEYFPFIAKEKDRMSSVLGIINHPDFIEIYNSFSQYIENKLKKLKSSYWRNIDTIDQ